MTFHRYSRICVKKTSDYGCLRKTGKNDKFVRRCKLIFMIQPQAAESSLSIMII